MIRLGTAAAIALQGAQANMLGEHSFTVGHTQYKLSVLE